MQALAYTSRTLDQALTEITRLRALNAVLKQERKTAVDQLKALQKKYAELNTKFEQLSIDHDRTNYELDELQRILFGAKSERITSDEQPSEVLLKDAPKVRTVTVHQRVPATKKRPVRQGLPAYLRRKVIRLDVPDTDREGRVQMNVKITEVFGIKPPELYVIRYERPQYVDPKDPSRGVKIAPLPPRVFPKGNVSRSCSPMWQ